MADSKPSVPTPRWSARFDGDAHLDEGPAGIVATSDGSSVVVTGTSESANSGNDIVTVGYDAVGGTERWSARFDGSAHGNDRAVGISSSPDGGTVFVTGTTVGDVTHSDYVTIAYDAATGEIRWTSLLDGGHQKDTASAIGISPDGSAVYVTGTTGYGQPAEHMTTVAYAASTGFTLWQQSYAGPDPFGVIAEEGAALAVAPSGGFVYVTGQGYVPPEGSENGRSFDVVAYRASDGTQAWAARPVGWPCSYPYPSSLAVSPDGRTLVVSGHQDEGCNESFLGYATAAVDASTGETLWMTSPTGSYTTSTAGAYAVIFTPDGRRVIQTGNLLSPHYGTIAYSPADGSHVWSARYDGGRGPDLALAVGASPDSRTIFVTGISRGGPGGYDFATLAYRAADGKTLWAARYDDPQHQVDGAVALAIAPDGRTLYVTGWAGGAGTGSDYFTIAYPID